MELLKKFKNSLALKILLLLAFITYIYYGNNVTGKLNIWTLGWIMYIIIGFIWLYLALNKKLTHKTIIFMILISGFVLRINYGAYNNIFSRQHDVGNASELGHYGYALYIFRNGSLPSVNYDQFYQPPLNAIIQAIWMKINSLFIKPSSDILEAYKLIFNGSVEFPSNEGVIWYLDSLYNTTRILSTFYSCLIPLITYYILKELKLSKTVTYITLSLISVQPVLVMMAGTVNNDVLSYVFFFLAIYLAIKWFNKQTYTTSILLALAIGLGMITKLSIGFVAIIIAPLMLIRLYEAFKQKRVLPLIYKLGIFGIIVFPLGLSYAIRNLILFDQSLTYILDFGRDSWLHAVIKEKTIVERFISFPISRFLTEEYGIFHDYQEYNIWVDLFKTSIFEEFSYYEGAYKYIMVIFSSHVIIFLVSIFSFIYTIYKLIKEKTKENLFTIILAVSLIILALGSYLSLCIKMPYGCTSNFRYISYIVLGAYLLIGLMIDKLNNKKIENAFYSFITIYFIFTAIFILNI